MAVTFFIKSKTKERSSVGVSINFDGMDRIVLTIPDLKISPCDWENGRMITGRGKQTNYQIQRDLDSFKDKVELFFKEFNHVNGSKPDKNNFLKYLKSNKKLADYLTPTSIKLILPIIHEIIEKRKSGELLNGGKYWNVKTLQAQTTTYRSLLEYQRKRKIKITDNNVVNLDLILDFENFLTIEERLKLNTVGSRMKNFKALLGVIQSYGIIPINPFKTYKIPIVKEETDSIALDDNELRDLTHLDLSDNPKWDHIRNQYVLLCQIGTRISDFKMFNELNKEDDIITFRNKKTGAEISIPIFNEARIILNKYEGQKLIQSDESEINREIKKIGKLIPGLNREFIEEYTLAGKKVVNFKKRYEVLTIHCSRRTCITRLAAMGFPPHEIMIISGHKSIKTYEIYIKVNKRNVLKAMIEKVNQRSLEFNK